MGAFFAQLLTDVKTRDKWEPLIQELAEYMGEKGDGFYGPAALNFLDISSDDFVPMAMTKREMVSGSSSSEDFDADSKWKTSSRKKRDPAVDMSPAPKKKAHHTVEAYDPPVPPKKGRFGSNPNQERRTGTR